MLFYFNASVTFAGMMWITYFILLGDCYITSKLVCWDKVDLKDIAYRNVILIRM